MGKRIDPTISIMSCLEHFTKDTKDVWAFSEEDETPQKCRVVAKGGKDFTKPDMLGSRKNKKGQVMLELHAEVRYIVSARRTELMLNAGGKSVLLLPQRRRCPKNCCQTFDHERVDIRRPMVCACPIDRPRHRMPVCNGVVNIKLD
ncbi:hypothetical protein TNCV_3651991 [Trichonephila clavipes]|uniref:Uncharacterized protein n=1 Tax=Trichonephila clavipes TaxID=2585209 RepID=A0A8X6V694_TRICX|nr:hypothetical protein TNCV_3651991 [Trichonephila clavipes]